MPHRWPRWPRRSAGASLPPAIVLPEQTGLPRRRFLSRAAIAGAATSAGLLAQPWAVEAAGNAVPVTTFNIEKYGADRSGSSDSTAAIQKAITLAQGVGGGTVLIPPGLFRITGTLNVTGAINIQGASQLGSVLLVDFNTWGLNVQARGVVLANFGLFSKQGGGTGQGLYVANSFGLSLNNLWFQNLANAIWVQSCGNIDAMTINVFGHTQYAIRIQDCESDLFFSKVHTNNAPNTSGYGLYLSNCSGAKFTDCDFIGGQLGIMIDLGTGASNPVNRWLQFLSVDADTVSQDPWHIVSAQGLQMVECWSGSFPNGTGIWLGSGVNQASIVNHQWQSGLIGVGNNAAAVAITGGIMGGLGTKISSSVTGQPTVVNVVGYP